MIVLVTELRRPQKKCQCVHADLLFLALGRLSMESIIFITIFSCCIRKDCALPSWFDEQNASDSFGAFHWRLTLGWRVRRGVTRRNLFWGSANSVSHRSGRSSYAIDTKIGRLLPETWVLTFAAVTDFCQETRFCYFNYWYRSINITRFRLSESFPWLKFCSNVLLTATRLRTNDTM